MHLLNLSLKKIMLLAALFLLAASAWHFLQSDEKYLQQKTKYLISLTAVPTPLSQIKAIQRVNKIASFLYFNISIQWKTQDRNYTTKNLQHTKSVLLSYFIQAQTALWETKNLSVTLNQKTAKVLVTVKGHHNKRNQQCRLAIKWFKEKKWLISNVEVLECSSLDSP